MDERSGELVRAVFAEHRRVVEASAAILPPTIEAIVDALERCLRGGGKVLACGNGGSAADAQHFASELVGRLEFPRRALAAISLATDGSTLTAIANDTGYDRVFARQIEAIARSGDVLIALSTSGRSPSVLAAARAARAAGCRVVALTGSGGGELVALAELALVVPSAAVQRVQEVHSLCLHAIAEALEQAFSEERA